MTHDGAEDIGEAARRLTSLLAGRYRIVREPGAVIYTMRGDVCRIISARRANRREQEAYRKAKSG